MEVNIKLTSKEVKRLMALLDREADSLNDADDSVLGAWPLQVISQKLSLSLSAPVNAEEVPHE